MLQPYQTSPIRTQSQYGLFRIPMKFWPMTRVIYQTSERYSGQNWPGPKIKSCHIRSTAADQSSLIVQRELKKKQRYFCPSFFSGGGTRRSTILEKQRRTNGSNMGEPIRTRKGKLAGRGKHDARLGHVVQVKKRGGGYALIWAQRERNLQWRKQLLRMFGPEFIGINSLIKTARSAVSKNRVERDFFFAASNAKFWKRDISSASERAFPGVFDDIFGCSTPSKKSCFSTQDFTRF